MLKQGGRKVGMVGDGINDAPAPVEVNGALPSAPPTWPSKRLISRSRAAVSGVWPTPSRPAKRRWQIAGQGLFGAFIYNSIGVPSLQMGCFLLRLLLPPLIAGEATAASSITVVIMPIGCALEQGFAQTTGNG